MSGHYEEQWIATPGGLARMQVWVEDKTPPANWSNDVGWRDYTVSDQGLPQLTTPGAYTTDASGHQYSVSTSAILQYVDVLEQLVQPLINAQDQLAAVKIHSGKFQASTDLMVKVNGGSASAEGVADQYATELASMAGAVDTLAVGLRELAQKYTTAEELNSAEANAALGELLSDFGDGMPGGTSY